MGSLCDWAVEIFEQCCNVVSEVRRTGSSLKNPLLPLKFGKCDSAECVVRCVPPSSSTGCSGADALLPCCSAFHEDPLIAYRAFAREKRCRAAWECGVDPYSFGAFRRAVGVEARDVFVDSVEDVGVAEAEVARQTAFEDGEFLETLEGFGAGWRGEAVPGHVQEYEKT